LLAAQATETATHTWTVYLRSPLNQNLGQIIRKVIFHLHDSFANPNRDVKSPPFELKENGWGEFDILIEVGYFITDVDETMSQVYRLFFI
jgi:YEATS domain-containing protein 4